MPPSEPSPQDVSQVAATLDSQPTTSQPAQQQSPTPSQQPAQPPADPFQQFAATEQPTDPTTPTPTQQPPQSQSTEPTPQTEETSPAPQPPAELTVDDYMRQVLEGAPESPDMPDPGQVNPEDETSINTFFTDLMSTAEKRFEANFERKQAIQSAERNLWEDAFATYPSLRANKPLRDMVHAIRRADFDKGVAITPTQAANRLLDTLKIQYDKGVADNQVATTIEQVQPQGGGSQEVPTTLSKTNVLEAVQTGGEQALTDYLNSEIKAGRL